MTRLSLIFAADGGERQPADQEQVRGRGSRLLLQTHPQGLPVSRRSNARNRLRRCTTRVASCRRRTLAEAEVKGQLLTCVSAPRTDQLASAAGCKSSWMRSGWMHHWQPDERAQSRMASLVSASANPRGCSADSVLRGLQRGEECVEGTQPEQEPSWSRNLTPA